MKTLVLVSMAVVMMAHPSSAHDFYDAACCSDKDCAPYSGNIREEPTGYRITETRELIEYKYAKVSPDGRFHRCVYPSGETRCLYAPPRGF